MSKKFKKVNSEVKNIEEVEEFEVEVETKNEEVTVQTEEEAPLEVPSIAIEDMKDREVLEQMYWILKDIEAKLAKTPITEVTKSKAGRVGARKTPNQKKEYKAELLAKGPYTKEQLVAMKRSDLAMYAGALELGKAKSFGLPTDVLIANILVGQKPKK